MLSWYHDNINDDGGVVSEVGPVPDRTQTGLRMDRTLIKVLKGLAEYLNMSLADLVEGILLHGLEGRSAITDETTLETIQQLRQIYGMQLTAEDSHKHPDVA
jgi:hypothetical protein